MTGLPKGADRPVLITGCSSGIGRCAARMLRQRGYLVLATARQLADVEDLRQEGFHAWRLDLAAEDSIHQALGEILPFTQGRLYGLFNNGAYGQPGALEDLPVAALRQQFQTNVFGLHELTRRVIPIMRQQGMGRIVQNSSVLGFVAMPYRGAYVASKYAVEGLTDTLRLELAGSGVFASLIEPGPIASRFRNNAHQAFLRHVDGQNSRFARQYEAMIARLNGPATPFTLPPEAVVGRLIQALEETPPRARYRVTLPTHLFARLKCLLSDRLLDALLSRH